MVNRISHAPHVWVTLLMLNCVDAQCTTRICAVLPKDKQPAPVGRKALRHRRPRLITSDPAHKHAPGLCICLAVNPRKPMTRGLGESGACHGAHSPTARKAEIFAPTIFLGRAGRAATIRRAVCSHYPPPIWWRCSCATCCTSAVTWFTNCVKTSAMMAPPGVGRR